MSMSSLQSRRHFVFFPDDSSKEINFFPCARVTYSKSLVLFILLFLLLADIRV